MKKFGFFVLAILFSASAFAQIDLKKASGTATALGFDVNKMSQSIMSSLTNKVGLSSAQVTKVTPLVSQFLTNKSSFISIMQSKPAEYKTKFEAEQKTLFDGMKGQLTPAQYTQFLGLKPKQADAADAMSQLFF